MSDENKKTVLDILETLETMQGKLNQLRSTVAELYPDLFQVSEPSFQNPAFGGVLGRNEETPEGKVIEGIFDGQNMIGAGGKQYAVPSNYASKSKLVEGDHLKLTITPDGSFIYKQIGPVERQRVVGVLSRDERGGEFRVLAQGKIYKILLASVTYFKGEVGDEVVILLPAGQSCTWAAVENIIKLSSSSLPAAQALAEEVLLDPIEDH
ncbi:MAG: hypothetical protein AAB733_00040 [Patescibacteria group bacterium]